jgi:hypothetical protein
MKRIYHLPKAKPIQYSEEFQDSRLNFTAVEMELQAIICLVNTNHFVSFVKCGSERLAPWIQQDSMYKDASPQVRQQKAE